MSKQASNSIIIKAIVIITVLVANAFIFYSIFKPQSDQVGKVQSDKSKNDLLNVVDEAVPSDPTYQEAGFSLKLVEDELAASDEPLEDEEYDFRLDDEEEDKFIEPSVTEEDCDHSDDDYYRDIEFLKYEPGESKRKRIEKEKKKRSEARKDRSRQRKYSKSNPNMNTYHNGKSKANNRKNSNPKMESKLNHSATEPPKHAHDKVNFAKP